MRSFHLYFLLVILYSICSCRSTPAVPHPRQLEQSGIEGPVSRMETHTYAADSSATGWSLIETSVELFNDQGNTPSDTLVNVSSGDVFIDVLTYNNNHAVLSTTTFKNGTALNTLAFRYNDQGRLQRIDIMKKDSLTDYYQITALSEKGDLQSGKHYSPAGKFLGSFEYEYDGFAPVSRKFMNDSGYVFESVQFKLNKQKWPTQEIFTSMLEQSGVADTTVFRYDALDSFGNWQQLLMLRQEKPFKKKVRQITYYPKK